MLLSRLIHSSGIKMVSTGGAPRNPEFPNSTGWTVILKYGGRSMTLSYYMGSAHGGKAPDINSVVNSLVLDVQSLESARNFEDWAAENGYKTNKYDYPEEYKRSKQVHDAVIRQTTKLKHLLGSDYNKFIEAENDI